MLQRVSRWPCHLLITCFQLRSFNRKHLMNWSCWLRSTNQEQQQPRGCRNCNCLSFFKKMWCLPSFPFIGAPCFPRDRTAGVSSRRWTVTNMSKSSTYTVASLVCFSRPIHRYDCRGVSRSSNPILLRLDLFYSACCIDAHESSTKFSFFWFNV